MTLQVAFDGSKAYRQFDTHGFIEKPELFSFSEYDPRYMGGLAIFHYPISSFLKGELISGKTIINNTHYLKKEFKNGQNCLVFQGYLSDNADTLTVWISPDVMYRPIYYELTDKFSKRVRTYNFKKINNLWFPKQMIENFYRIDEKTGEYNLIMEGRYTVDDNFVINTDIPDSKFKINFPKGFLIKDDILGKSYYMK